MNLSEETAAECQENLRKNLVSQLRHLVKVANNDLERAQLQIFNEEVIDILYNQSED